MKIRFLQNREVFDHEKRVVASYKAGQVLDMIEPSARHWLNRGIAVEQIEMPEAPEPKRGRKKQPDPEPVESGSD